MARSRAFFEGGGPPSFLRPENRLSQHYWHSSLDTANISSHNLNAHGRRKRGRPSSRFSGWAPGPAALSTAMSKTDPT